MKRKITAQSCNYNQSERVMHAHTLSPGELLLLKVLLKVMSILALPGPLVFHHAQESLWGRNF